MAEPVDFQARRQRMDELEAALCPQDRLPEDLRKKYIELAEQQNNMSNAQCMGPVFVFVFLAVAQILLCHRVGPDLKFWMDMTKAVCLDGRSATAAPDTTQFSLELGPTSWGHGDTKYDMELYCEIPATVYTQMDMSSLLTNTHPERKLATSKICPAEIRSAILGLSATCDQWAPAAQWCIQQVKTEPYVCYVSPQEPGAGVQDLPVALPLGMLALTGLVAGALLALLCCVIIPGMLTNDFWLWLVLVSWVICGPVLGILVAACQFPLKQLRLDTTVGDFEAHGLPEVKPARQWGNYDTFTFLGFLGGLLLSGASAYFIRNGMRAIRERRLQTQAKEATGHTETDYDFSALWYYTRMM